MPKDESSGMIEPNIVVNGRALTFAECMSVRVAIGSFRLYVRSNDQLLGKPLAAGYDFHLANVERAMLQLEPAKPAESGRPCGCDPSARYVSEQCREAGRCLSSTSSS
jgi:hypothetical protein